MGKSTICIGENKGTDQLRSNREADQHLCFLYLLFYLNPKFLCLYRSVCVGPVRKPHCWFSHEVAQMCICPNIGYVRGSPNGKICKSTNGTVGTIFSSPEPKAHKVS